MTAAIDEQAALLRTIRSDPDDDTPRLIYADWLQERDGDMECPDCRGSARPFEWNFGDGHISHDRSPTHVYNEPGEYAVTLTVTDSCRCSGSGRVPNNYAARAELIRVQVELAKMPAPYEADYDEGGYCTLCGSDEVSSHYHCVECGDLVSMMGCEKLVCRELRVKRGRLERRILESYGHDEPGRIRPNFYDWFVRDLPPLGTQVMPTVERGFVSAVAARWPEWERGRDAWLSHHNVVLRDVYLESLPVGQWRVDAISSFANIIRHRYFVRLGDNSGETFCSELVIHERDLAAYRGVDYVAVCRRQREQEFRDSLPGLLAGMHADYSPGHPVRFHLPGERRRDARD